MKTFEYRLYMNKEQARSLMACLVESRHIYHAMLERVKQQYEEQGTFPSKYALEHAFQGHGHEHVPATTVYNGPRNLDTKRGENKIYSRHDEKTVYRRF